MTSKCPFCGNETKEDLPIEVLRSKIPGARASSILNLLIDAHNIGITIDDITVKLYPRNDHYTRNSVSVIIVRMRERIRSMGWTIETYPRALDSKHAYFLKRI